jgi:hypothetical protein
MAIPNVPAKAIEEGLSLLEVFASSHPGTQVFKVMPIRELLMLYRCRIDPCR